MNISNAYTQARSALCFEKLHFAVTVVQLDNVKDINVKAKNQTKNQSTRPQAIPF